MPQVPANACADRLAPGRVCVPALSAHHQHHEGDDVSQARSTRQISEEVTVAVVCDGCGKRVNINPPTRSYFTPEGWTHFDADALAQEAIDAHDGGPHAPMVVDGGTAIRRGDASAGVRREIERLWADGHSINDIAHFLVMTPAEITEHMRVMRGSTLYTTRRTLTPTQRALREATTPREHE